MAPREIEANNLIYKHERKKSALARRGHEKTEKIYNSKA